jgi:hypothetical protein
LKIKKTATYYIINPDPGLEQAHKWGSVKHGNWIPTISFLKILSPTAAIQINDIKKNCMFASI